MRIGYSFWGFQGDYKYNKDGYETSSPDGNSTYSWSVIHKLQSLGHTVYLMQQNRDKMGFSYHKNELFSSFSLTKRKQAYNDCITTTDCINGSYGSFPDLDILLLEWRFPIPGRNVGRELHHFDYTPDLDRQNSLLGHYKKKDTKIIFWDLDHKLTKEDEEKWDPDMILETSEKPLKLFKERTKVYFPIYVEDLLQHRMRPIDKNKKLAYIGSRYERDDVIDEWIKPFSDKNPQTVQFYGNWLKSLDSCKAKWPNVSYNDRVTTRDFLEIYSNSVACPLLAKKSYLETGFMTPRIWEAILFGTLPVGFDSHNGIGNYLPRNLIAKNSYELNEIVNTVENLDLKSRELIRRNVVDCIEFMDVSNFVNTILA